MKTKRRLIAGITACGALALLSGCTSGDAFTKLDSNRNGSGSPEEFDAYMKEAVFTRVDSNADGKVTLEEWQACNPKVDETKFKKVDRNGDGCVVRKEADAAFDREKSLDELFDEIDVNKDGSLSPDEVSAYRSKMRKESGAIQSKPTSTPLDTP